MANTGKTNSGSTNIKDKAEQLTSQAARTANDLKGKAQEAVSSAGQKVQETAGNIAHKAQDTAANLTQKAQDFAAHTGDKADDAISSVGEKMTSLAGTIREKAPHEGTLGTAATAVADGLQAGGHYLQENDLQDMVHDLSAMIRQYPLQSVLVGFGVGCLFGMTCGNRR